MKLGMATGAAVGHVLQRQSFPFIKEAQTGNSIQHHTMCITAFGVCPPPQCDVSSSQEMQFRAGNGSRNAAAMEVDLPVFCVSARDAQKLEKRGGRDGRVTAFGLLSDTEVGT